MNIISIIIVLAIIGVVLALIQQIPMDATIRTIIRVVVILAAIVWLLNAVGLLGGTTLRLR